MLRGFWLLCAFLSWIDLPGLQQRRDTNGTFGFMTFASKDG